MRSWGLTSRSFAFSTRTRPTYSTKGMPVALRKTSLKYFALRLTACAAAASEPNLRSEPRPTAGLCSRKGAPFPYSAKRFVVRVPPDVRRRFRGAAPPLVLGRGDHPCVEIRFLHLLQIDMGAPSKQRLCQTAEFRLRWMVNEDVPRLQPSDDVLADAHGHRGFTQAREHLSVFGLMRASCSTRCCMARQA